MELDKILDESKEEVVEEVKEAVKEEVKEEVKAEPEVKPEVKPKEEESDKEKAYLAAALDERNKRQKIEKELSELKGKQETKPFWDDPEGSLGKFKDEIKGMIVNTQLNTSEAVARSKYKDFDEAVQVFAEVLQQTPGLHNTWLASPDPGEFAYRTGKNMKELRDVGNMESLRQKIEKETRVKIETELKEKAEKLTQEREALPGTLSDAHSKGQNKAVWGGPTPLDSILNSK